MAKNLWGALPDVRVIVTPTVLMKEQAAVLQEMTKGLLTCEVTKSIANDTISEIMRIVAPSLGNYRSTILYVQHGAVSYPCTAVDQVSGLGSRTIAGHEEFSAFLAEVLGSTKTKELIGQLLAEIRANADQDPQ